ncbi:hypothetical protein DFJ73DRAFT_760442 [Zopfochytrium polystomum]|nr:hypothetical protein DFJ73DRAFT_760442 [Zopfochytrium polystomum]
MVGWVVCEYTVWLATRDSDRKHKGPGCERPTESPSWTTAERRYAELRRPDRRAVRKTKEKKQKHKIFNTGEYVEGRPNPANGDEVGLAVNAEVGSAQWGAVAAAANSGLTDENDADTSGREVEQSVASRAEAEHAVDGEGVEAAGAVVTVAMAVAVAAARAGRRDRGSNAAAVARDNEVDAQACCCLQAREAAAPIISFRWCCGDK